MTRTTFIMLAAAVLIVALLASAPTDHVDASTSTWPDVSLLVPGVSPMADAPGLAPTAERGNVAHARGPPGQSRIDSSLLQHYEAGYWGREVPSATACTAAITASRTSADVGPSTLPGARCALIHFSAKDSTITGGSGNAWQDAEYKWDFDDPGVQVITPDGGPYASASTDLSENTQWGPEAAYAYTSSGSYTVTLTMRVWHGSGYVTDTDTQSITINQGTWSSVKFFDATNGNDSNDGNDGLGFALTGASYTHSTKTITKSGAFSSYTWVSGDVLYISGGTNMTVGRYVVASKTDSNSIVLETTAGSADSSNVTSSNGPWKTYNKMNTTDRTANAVRVLKRGETFVTDSTGSIEFRESKVRYGSYGNTASAKPIIQVSGSFVPTTGVFYIRTNTGSPSDIAYCNIEVDCNAQNVTPFNFTNSNGSLDKVYLYQVDVDAGVSGSNFDIDNISWNPNNTEDCSECGMWRCTLDQGDTQGQGVWARGILTGSTRDKYFCVVGCSFTGGDGNNNLDHHVYPKSFDHALFSFNGFSGATKLSSCINSDCFDTAGEFTEFWLLTDNLFSGTERVAIDCSNQNDDTDGRFRNYVAARNDVGDFDSDADQGIVFNCMSGDDNDIIWRDNNIWDSNGNGGGAYPVWRFGNGICKPQIYRNQIHTTLADHYIIDLAEDTADGAYIYDNHVHSTASDVKFVNAPIGDTLNVVDYNRWYSPSDTTPFRDETGAATKTWVEWQELNPGDSVFGFNPDPNGVNTDPGWNDPGNGDFTVTSIVADRLEFGTNTSTPLANGGTMTTFTIKAVDGAGGPTDTAATGNVTVSKVTGGGTLGGTLIVALSSGVSSFAAVTYTGTSATTDGETFTLKGTHATLTETASSNAVTVQVTATALSWVVNPGLSQTVGVPWASYSIEAVDANGARDVDQAGSVVTTLVSGAGSLSGNSVALSSGLSTFTTTEYDTAETISVKGALGGLTDTTTIGSIVVGAAGVAIGFPWWIFK